MKRRRERFKGLFYILLPAGGVLFLLWYLKAAGADVVYSDYFRIINDYLPDVTDPGRFLVPDILTRIPITFLQRLANVTYFSYSVTFDRLCGLLGIAMTAGGISVYARRMGIGRRWLLAALLAVFCLNKWEILLNGTAWVHMFSLGLFFINFYLFDLLWIGESTARDDLMLCIMPFLWLLTAGEYVLSYFVIMILASLFGILTGGAARRGTSDQRLFFSIMSCSIIALTLYLFSRSFAVWEHSGAVEASQMGLIGLVKEQPLFLPVFFVKSFASAIIGVESAQALALPEPLLLLLGLLLIAAYMLAIYLYFKGEMLEKTVFPLMLLFSGGLNHCMVTAARWIFLNDSYGMSSRYAGQYLPGILGIFLIFALYREEARPYRRLSGSAKSFIKIFLSLSTVCILLGNCYTDVDEIRKAKYREANFEEMTAVLRGHEAYEDEELCRLLEWHKDPGELKNAIGILETQQLNVFKPAAPGIISVPEPGAAAGGNQ